MIPDLHTHTVAIMLDELGRCELGAWGLLPATDEKQMRGRVSRLGPARLQFKG